MKIAKKIFDSLGLTIHLDKSILIPTQEIQYLGFILNSREMTVQLTREKALKIKELCQNILCLEYISIREFSELMGKTVSSEYGIPYAILLHKRLQFSKNEQLRRHYGNNDATFALNKKCIEYIQWWVKNVETSKKHVCIGNHTVVITSDTSLSGWGRVYENNSTGGRWSVDESSYHINQLD
jgi:hypothetical protein